MNLSDLKRSTLPVLLAGGFLAIAASPAGAATAGRGTVEALEAQLGVEERLLERARGRYREARALERRVLLDLRESSEQQDALLDRMLRDAREAGSNQASGTADPAAQAAALQALRSAERELAGTRETALTLARESADLRRDLAARAERVRELRTEIKNRARPNLVDPTGLDGRWRIELEDTDITGTIDLNSEGTLVTGAYRLTDGSQGSIRGTLVGSRLELDRIDWQLGFDTILRGELDASGGLIEGSWTSVDVSGGAPGSGFWSARRQSR